MQKFYLTVGKYALTVRQVRTTPGRRTVETPMIEAEGLTKRYGETQALAGVSFSVPAGSILGVLGPNGAGKSTAVKILTTYATADRGSARVAGIEVGRDPAAVRRVIGVTAQDATLDGLLTGRQNLEMIGELSGMRRKDTRRRAAELLERFEIADAADRVVKGYSGGMRRRLDIAASIINRPPVLFLDEPTTGLDPASRARVWELLRELVGDGLTLLLTTQYLDEADQLAERIVVIDHGRVIAEGTPAQLKVATGGLSLRLHLSSASGPAVAALGPFVTGPIDVSSDGTLVQASVASRPGMAVELLRALDAAGVRVDDLELHRPTLDDVFFSLTSTSTTTSGRAVPDPFTSAAADLADEPIGAHR
jgi:daunorubicin resistance ABC transporter ATP-binding subunit